MENDELIDSVFENGQYPWLLNENYRYNRKAIRKTSQIEFNKIGRILTCHLFIEHHLSKYIELTTPADFDWGNTKITFAQKLNLIKKKMLPADLASFYKCIESINKIRNKFSHDIEAQLNPEDVRTVRESLTTYLSQSESEIRLTQYTDIAVLELFTGIFCAFVHGLCANYSGTI